MWLHEVIDDATTQENQKAARGLPSLVSSLSLCRVLPPSGFASPCAWTCPNITMGGITLSTDYIRSAVEAKNEKAPNYSRDGAEELWLLITAACDTINNSAGPFIQHPNNTQNWTPRN